MVTVRAPVGGMLGAPRPGSAHGFVAYVRLGVLTANLLTLARHQLA